MKKYRKILMAAFIFMTTAFLVGLLTEQPAFTGDSGDEKVVEITRFECNICRMEVYTFTPDSIEGKSKRDNGMPDYQQKEWFTFMDYSKPIAKCSKSGIGAHFFEKKSNTKTSPDEIYRLREKIVVLKNGGTMNGKGVSEFKCLSCSKTFNGFEGDDMDSYGIIKLNEALGVLNMKNGSQISACNTVLIKGFPAVKAHWLRTSRTASTKSYELARNVSNLYWSK